jgi:hypothetical protein
MELYPLSAFYLSLQYPDMIQNGKYSHSDFSETDDTTTGIKEVPNDWRVERLFSSKLKKFLCPLQKKNEKQVMVMEERECTSYNSLFLKTYSRHESIIFIGVP